MTTRVTLFNASVRLETDDHQLQRHVTSFLNNYYKVQDISGFNTPEGAKEKIFAGKIKDLPIWQFHWNQFAHFWHYLKGIGYQVPTYDKVDLRNYTPPVVELEVREGWSFRDHQVPVYEFTMAQYNAGGTEVLMPLEPGAGKAQTLTSRIKTPGGWMFMRDMKIGTIITAKDGTPTKVTGVFPQGKTSVYRIQFSDGRICEASGDHLWKAYRKNKPSIKTTEEIAEAIRVKDPRISVDLCDSEAGEDVSLELHPYLLGILIGDGGISSKAVMLSTPDQEILDNVAKLIPDNLTIKYQSKYDYRISNKDSNGHNGNGIIDSLRKLNLMGSHSYTKFIPEEYLFASHNQRLQLLQGLMDTDGYVDDHSTTNYCTTSYRLAMEVQYLVRSLGGIASISEKMPWFTYNGDRKQGRKAYIVNIRYKRPSELFTLSRKKERCNDNNQYASSLKLKVISVTRIEDAETQCISIDHPDKLYVTDNFVVTHNTSTSLMTVSSMKTRVAVIVLANFLDKWVSDIPTIHNCKIQDVMVVRGGSSLSGLIDMAKRGELKHNYILFSLTTLYNYVVEYEFDPDACVEKFGCSPHELFELLGIGVAIADEVHLSFMMLYRTMIYMNYKFHIGLSATLMDNDPATKRAQKVFYPSKSVYGDAEISKYMDIYPIVYTATPQALKFIRTSVRGSNNYSHTEFEKSILRHPVLFKSYIRIIDATIQDYYTEHLMENDKLMIFVGTIKLATYLTAHLKEKFKDKVVTRYCEQDSYDDLLAADIAVTTVLSAGTGLDIPNLRVGIQTVSVASEKSNIQTAGRLRKLKDRDVKFCYLYCGNLGKQVNYHRQRMDIFRPRSASINLRRSRVNLG